jgi:hypothetical protein
LRRDAVAGFSNRKERSVAAANAGGRGVVVPMLAVEVFFISTLGLLTDWQAALATFGGYELTRETLVWFCKLRG